VTKGHLLRAATRVLLRVFAKAFAYGVILVGALWIAAGIVAGGGPALLATVALFAWASVALAVFLVKVREECARLRSNG
jgi:hypothetical protein